MGCFYELNDTLLISEKQGFPSNVFNYEEHIKKPVTLDDVKDEVFAFSGKKAARAFQLDPVRVFFFEMTADKKWLAWGKVAIQSLTIEHVPSDEVNPDNPIAFNPGDWLTSGTYKVIEVYDPEYQRIFTSHEAPAIWSFFGK